MKVFVVAGEASGDQLGGRLMAALRARDPAVQVVGVGGASMTGEGLVSLFPMSDLSVMGIGPVLTRLPLLIRRIRQTAAMILSERPDVVVLIDSPDFTHRVARKVRAAAPDIPIALYVSPTVWAWRPGRAAKMRPYTDLLLALLPFEPEAHRRLGGPTTVYVGHPVMDRLDGLRPAGSRGVPGGGRPARICVLPGSRRSEIRRLLPLFAETVALLRHRVPTFDLVLPAVDHLADEIAAATTTWAVRPVLAQGTEAKLAAFRESDVALAASGTVSLELGLAGLPHVIAYRLDWFGRQIVRRVLRVQPGLEDVTPLLSASLPNMLAAAAPDQTVLDNPRSIRSIERGPDLPVPEFIDHMATPEGLARAIEALLGDTAERRRQISAFALLERGMALAPGQSSADMAAAELLRLAHARIRNQA